MLADVREPNSAHLFGYSLSQLLFFRPPTFTSSSIRMYSPYRSESELLNGVLIASIEIEEKLCCSLQRPMAEA